MNSVSDRLVFVGINGHAIALDRATGRDVWRARLKGHFVNLVLFGEDLFATAQGEIFCLDPETGMIRWNNRLKGMGYGLATVAAPAAPIAPAAEQEQRDESTSGNGD